MDTRNSVGQPRAFLPMVFIGGALCFGAYLSRFNYLGMIPSCWLLMLTIIIWSILMLRRKTGEGRATRVLAQTCMVISLVGLGCSWHSLHWDYYHFRDIGSFAMRTGQPACVRGQVISAAHYRRIEPSADHPTSTTESTSFVIRVCFLRQGTQWREARGQLGVHFDEDARGFTIGTNVQILGTLLRPSPALNPGQFDRQLALQRRRQLATLFVPARRFGQVLPGDSLGSPGFRLTVFENIRAHARDSLAEHVAHDTLPIAETLLLGIRDKLNEDVRDAFVHTGLIHVLAISGLHIGILASFFWLTRRSRILSRVASLWMIAFFVLIFSQVAGARTPVIRASILVTLFCLAGGLNRAAQSWNLLAAAAVIIFVVDPQAVFDVGAQLSFIAVGALVASTSLARARREDRLEALILKYESKPKRWLRRVASLWPPCFAVYIATAPLVLYHHNLFTPAGVLLNPIICIPLTVALYAGMVGLLAASTVPSVAALAGTVCDIAIRSMLSLIEPWDQPKLYCWLPGPSNLWLWSYYAILSIRFGPWPISFMRTRSLLCCLLLGGVALHPTLTREWWPHRELRMTCIAVGHGTSILLEFPNGSVWLYDCGALGDARHAVDAVQASLWQRGIRRIDQVVLSHADADHFNALPGLMQKFKISRVLVSPHMFARTNGSEARLQAKLIDSNQEIAVIKAGDRLSEGQVECSVIHPSTTAAHSDNENSVVLRIVFDQHTILLTGDLEGTELSRLLLRSYQPVDILQAPHHGSPRSRPRQVARWCQPRIVCICSGLNFDVQRTRRAYRTGGARVLHTAKNGQFELRMRGGDPRIRLLTPVWNRL